MEEAGGTRGRSTATVCGATVLEPALLITQKAEAADLGMAAGLGWVWETAEDWGMDTTRDREWDQATAMVSGTTE